MRSMFNLSRYLPLTRSTPESPATDDDPPTNTSGPSEPAREIGSVEMATLRRLSSAPESSPVYRARVIGVIPGSRLDDDSFEDIEFEDTPSPTAVAAVRVCVWAFFLFGFLVLFQNQQENFVNERTRQNGRLRSSQLIHLNIPWTDYSGFTENTTCLSANFIGSNSSTFSVYKLIAGQKSVTVKRDGFSQMRISDSSAVSPTASFVQGVGSTFVNVQKSAPGMYSFDQAGVSLNLTLRGDLIFFRLMESDRSVLTISRPSSTAQHLPVDCLSTFNLSTSASCVSSRPILRANTYYYDDLAGVLASVGTDEWTSDLHGNNLHGIFVQSTNPATGATEISLTLPFLNRYDDGIWTLQNAPLTNGYVVLLPTMGFPPAPIQHLIALKDQGSEVPRGSVLRLENEGLMLFRRIDSVKFNVSSLDTSVCSC